MFSKLPQNLPILPVRRNRRGPQTSSAATNHRDFRVQQKRIEEWLIFLRDHHPACEDIVIDIARLSDVPNDASIGDRLLQVSEVERSERFAALSQRSENRRRDGDATNDVSDGSGGNVRNERDDDDRQRVGDQLRRDDHHRRQDEDNGDDDDQEDNGNNQQEFGPEQGGASGLPAYEEPMLDKHLGLPVVNRKTTRRACFGHHSEASFVGGGRRKLCAEQPRSGFFFFFSSCSPRSFQDVLAGAG